MLLYNRDRTSITIIGSRLGPVFMEAVVVLVLHEAATEWEERSIDCTPCYQDSKVEADP